MKFLPRAEFEPEGAERIRVRRVISRRHPVKTMFMGVITEPIPEQNFDGKISLLRLSRQEELAKGTHRYRFHIDHEINNMIKSGDWRQVQDEFDDPTYTISEISAMISLRYELEADIERALCFTYTTHVGEQRTEKKKKLFDHETFQGKRIVAEDGVERALTIDDVELSCYYPRGTIVEKEVSCDSRFMTESLPKVGADIRLKMPWIALEETMYLVMDNAGGHGTVAAVEEYTEALRQDYNVEIIFQAARSPEVNVFNCVIILLLEYCEDNNNVIFFIYCSYCFPSAIKELWQFSYLFISFLLS
jgi:hypothetical protein